MMRDELELKDIIKDAYSDLDTRTDHFSKVIQKIEHHHKSSKKYFSFFRVVLPVSLSFLLFISVVFPVFGNEANLIDVYQNYRIHRGVRAIQHIQLTGVSGDHQMELRQLLINTLLEKDFHFSPVQIQQMLSQNMDSAELIGMAILSRISTQKPELLVQQMKKENWSQVLRKNRIPPGRLIKEMRHYTQNIRNKPQKIILVRGIVEAYSFETGALILNGVPFAIHILPDTKINRDFADLSPGADIYAEIAYHPVVQRMTALSIRAFNPSKEGFRVVIGQITFRDRHLIRMTDATGTEELIFLAPNIMRHPGNFYIQPGALIRFIAVQSPQGGTVAVHFRPEA